MDQIIAHAGPGTGKLLCKDDCHATWCDEDQSTQTGAERTNADQSGPEIGPLFLLRQLIKRLLEKQKSIFHREEDIQEKPFRT